MLLDSDSSVVEPADCLRAPVFTVKDRILLRSALLTCAPGVEHVAAVNDPLSLLDGAYLRLKVVTCIKIACVSLFDWSILLLLHVLLPGQSQIDPFDVGMNDVNIGIIAQLSLLRPLVCCLYSLL